MPSIASHPAPKLFVLIPFYEGEDDLRACVRSLRHQQADFTAVVVDDGSSASTRRHVQQLLGDDSRFILLERPTREGPAAARVTGLDFICETSTSDEDVVVLVDGDDRLIRDFSLHFIERLYQKQPHLKMTFGRSITSGGERLHERQYQSWHLRLQLARHLLSWRGDHPRSFRLGLFRQCRDQLRFKYPNGQWLQGGTDIALLLPMLQRCTPGEVAHVDITLYEYNFDRADGGTLGTNSSGRDEQLLGEYFARRSVWFSLWKLLRYPNRSLRILRCGFSKLTSQESPPVEMRSKPSSSQHSREASASS